MLVLIDNAGLRDEIVIQRPHLTAYTHALRLAGAKLVEVGYLGFPGQGITWPWQIEAAIPLVELTGDPVTLGKAWACNIVRIVPGRGVQALSLPADVQPRPEGMGLLIFTDNPSENKK